VRLTRDERPPGNLGGVGISKEVSMKPCSKEFRGEVLAVYDRGGAPV